MMRGVAQDNKSQASSGYIVEIEGRSEVREKSQKMTRASIGIAGRKTSGRAVKSLWPSALSKK
eukprot:scaffold160617_cov32-Tisochrysis_lutea.AAC.1